MGYENAKEMLPEGQRVPTDGHKEEAGATKSKFEQASEGNMELMLKVDDFLLEMASVSDIEKDEGDYDKKMEKLQRFIATSKDRADTIERDFNALVASGMPISDKLKVIATVVAGLGSTFGMLMSLAEQQSMAFLDSTPKTFALLGGMFISAGYAVYKGCQMPDKFEMHDQLIGQVNGLAAGAQKLEDEGRRLTVKYLVHGGAAYVKDEGVRGQRLEVTKEQIEKARREGL